MSRFSWLSLALLAIACAGAESVEVEEQESALASERFTAPIHVQDSGHYSRYVYHGATSESFWVDLNVQNASPTKEVGVVWSTDGFRTQATTRAVFEAYLGNGRERWGVDVRDFAGRWGGQPIEVEYAAYVTMNGRTEWSALRNHYIYDVVTAERPVRLLSSSVALVEGVPHLQGTVRALNVASARKVFVRFTTDDWASFEDVQASFGGKDFTFEVALPFSASTEQVQFAVRFESEGESHWDSQNGANYRHQLAPALASQGLTPTSEFGLNGYLTLDAGLNTALGVSAARVRVGGGAPVELPLINYVPGQTAFGYSREGGVHFLLELAALTEGEHTLVLEVEAGPFVRAFPALTFTVDHTLASAATLPLVEGTTAWDMELAADGAVYVATDRLVFKYAELGAEEPLTFVETPDTGYLRRLTVDDKGRVYVLHSRDAVARFLPDGQLDTSFGTDGVRLLDESYEGTPLCFPADFAVAFGQLVVVDSCTPRLVRFTLEGDFVDQLELAPLGYTYAGSLQEEESALWLSVSTYDALGLHNTLLRLDDALAVTDSIELDARLGQLESFAVAASGIWVSGYDGTLHLGTPGGEPSTGFAGGDGSLDLPGAHSGLSALHPLSADLVLGLDRTGNELEVYRVTGQPEAQ